MAEEKKAAPKQKKKAAASKKEVPKTVAKKTATKAEPKAQDKNILSVGDVVKDKEGKEYIFVRPSRKERVVLREKDSNIEVVIDKDLLVK